MIVKDVTYIKNDILKARIGPQWANLSQRGKETLGLCVFATSALGWQEGIMRPSASKL